MINEDLWNNFIEKDAENNLFFIHRYFGILSSINGFDVSSNLIHLDDLDQDIFTKWYLVLDNAKYIRDDKIFDAGELIELLKFYYNCLNNDIGLALGNVHMLTGARGLIISEDVEGNKNLLEHCETDEDSDFEEFLKIIISYNNRLTVLYISKGEMDYV